MVVPDMNNTNTSHHGERMAPSSPHTSSNTRDTDGTSVVTMLLMYIYSRMAENYVYNNKQSRFFNKAETLVSSKREITYPIKC